jgi:hypothetical protein
VAESTYDRARLTLLAINAVLSAGLVVGVIFARQEVIGNRRAMIADQDQRQRQYTLTLYDSWRNVLDTGTARKSLDLLEILSPADLALVARGADDNAALQAKLGMRPSDLRRDLLAILNLFEQITVAYRDRVGNQEMIRRYFEASMRRMVPKLEVFDAKYDDYDWSVV